MGNEKSFAFFVCVEYREEYDLIKANLDELFCPAGYKVFIIWVKADVYNSSTYNNVMQKNNSKYKIYIHAGVQIVNGNFLHDILNVFSDDNIAMLGFWGTLEKPVSGNWHNAKDKIGKAWTAEDGNIVEKAFGDFQKTIDVRWLDCSCFATQYDLQWQEDFTTSYFSVFSHCEDFAVAGKKVVVPYQKEAWCYYDNLNEPVIDNNELTKYIGMYAPYLMQAHEKCPMNNLLFFCGRNVEIHEEWRFYASEGISIGNNVSIQKGAWFLLPYNNYNGEPRIVISDGCDLGYRLCISSSNKVILEEYVLIAANVHITDHNHNYDLVGIPIRYQGISSFSNVVVIGRGSWIANNVVIAGNVKIGKGCAIGANSVVTSDIPSYCVAAGSPARVVKAFDCKEKRWVKIKSEADLQSVLASRPSRDDVDKRPILDMHIFERKNIIKLFLREENDELALREIASLAVFLFEYNQSCSDDFLENTLLEIGNRLGLPACERQISDIRSLKNCKVLFYDGFGLDTRGLAQIYLEALVELGCHVVYVTKMVAKNKIPTLLGVLQRGNAEVIYIPQTGYIETTQILNNIINKSKPEVGFLYIEPYDLPGIMAFNNATGKFKRYLINLTDHAFWLGTNAFDYCLEFRNYGASLSEEYRKIPCDKLIMQPYYPPINTKFTFEGYPFEKKEDDFIIFSGGSLYKTIDRENTYYKLVDWVLQRFSHVKFWYAGNGSCAGLDWLLHKWPGRVFHTPERRDLFYIMKNIDLYLNTYPAAGGLMSQFSILAGKVPLTLCREGNLGGLLIDEENLGIVYSDIKQLKKEMIRLIGDAGYRRKKERMLSNAVIGKDCFTENLGNIIIKNSSKFKREAYDIKYNRNLTEQQWYERFILSHQDLLQDF